MKKKENLNLIVHLYAIVNLWQIHRTEAYPKPDLGGSTSKIQPARH